LKLAGDFMSSLPEIESAIRQLSLEERQRLLLSLAQAIREETRPLPPPRDYSVEEMTQWMDDDEAEFKQLRGKA
jgi:hypothetical protein